MHLLYLQVSGTIKRTVTGHMGISGRLWTRTENIKKLKIIHKDVIFMHNQQRPPEPHLKTNNIHKDVYITTSGVLLNVPKPSAHWEVFMILTYRAVRLAYNPGIVRTSALLSTFPKKIAARALRKVLKENWRDRHGLTNFFSDIAVQHSRYNETHTFTSQSSRTNT